MYLLESQAENPLVLSSMRVRGRSGNNVGDAVLVKRLSQAEGRIFGVVSNECHIDAFCTQDRARSRSIRDDVHTRAQRAEASGYVGGGERLPVDNKNGHSMKRRIRHRGYLAAHTLRVAWSMAR